MTIAIDVEDAAWQALPELEQVAERAARAALGPENATCSVTLLFTGDEDIRALNRDWRGKDKPTNVLSFPVASDAVLPPGEEDMLGDIALAFGTVAAEAEAQGKSMADHTTHLIIHGVLHLMGYDHETDAEAREMESLETAILKELGIRDPYQP
jgi:probable rRNA maturation factor